MIVNHVLENKSLFPDGVKKDIAHCNLIVNILQVLLLWHSARTEKVDFRLFSSSNA